MPIATRNAVLLLVLFASLLFCEVSGSNLCRLNEPCSVTYVTLGCFRDVEADRALPNYIYNERDATNSNYGNRNIQWHRWEKYIAEFSCRCARKAQEGGYDLFGVQFYGECWAGHSNTHDYKKHGSSSECTGDAYAQCSAFDRYCTGNQFTNFVYKIVTPSCDIEFERIGCYADLHNTPARPLGYYVLNDRDPTAVDSYSGRSIDWRNYDVYLPDFACRCAQKAQQNGSTYFGLQFYGECWTHPNGANTFSVDGATKGCKDKCFLDCGSDMGQICTGTQFKNYVYRIKASGQPACDVNIEAVGCYTEDPDDPALRKLLKSIKPSSTVFYGRRPVVGQWAQFFPDFLCTCGSIARSKGWQYFGISEYGECYSDIASSGYGRHGESQQCREGGENNACQSNSKLCAGKDATANYVYKVVT